MAVMATPTDALAAARAVYDAIPESTRVIEFIDGQILVTPPAMFAHQVLSAGLTHVLIAARPDPSWFVVTAPAGFFVGEDVFEPDIAVGRRSQATTRGIEGVPAMLAEIWSRSTASRDRGVKLRKYAAAGVAWYWLVDPRGPAARILHLVDGSYEVFGEYQGDDLIEVSEPFPLRFRLSECG